jgi:NADH-quinone oxidoreductase subunit L
MTLIEGVHTLLTDHWHATAWYATLPLWPLLGALGAGVLIALKQKATLAHWPVVIGVALAAVLGVTCFLDIGRRQVAANDGDHGGDAHAQAAVAQLVSHTPAPAEAPPAAHSHDTDAEQAHAEHAAADDHGDSHGTGVFTNPGYTYLVYNWISLGAIESLEQGRWLAINFYFDGLTGTMLLFFTIVALMVVIYAVGYMRDHHGHPEPGYERFFAFMGLFVFSMAMLVLAGNFVLLYLGWELVGLCSYLLIGFYFKKPEAAAAAKKAFIVNRIGDFGFALGIFSIYYFLAMGAHPLIGPGENPLDYETVFRYAAVLGERDSGVLGLSQASLISLLLMCGALGKSAQFPLYVWLPDAMEGPTPVSALIHAATMVTAGIYMIARCTPLFVASGLALEVVMWLGVIGAFLTATMAMAQYDMKRILAYSTISQLAFMFVALGCRAPDSAVFHVFTHAWFKALLFLGAGSVMHAMGGIIDVRRFSGLRSVLPKTHAVMLVGCLALSGFPLLAGFWSKDEIVHAAMHHNTVVGVIMLITAALTAYYTFRMYFLCFHGPYRVPDETGDHPHESPPVMIWPLYILAAGAIFTGYLGVTIETSASESFLAFLNPHGYIHHYMSYSTVDPAVAGLAAHHAGGGIWLAYVSAAIAIVGIGVAWLRYGRAPQVDPDRQALGPVFELWHAKYYVDEIYDRVFVRPLRGLGHVFFGTDRYGVDGLVWLVSAVPRGLSFGLHFLQRGAIQGYALSMAIGVAALLLLWNWLWIPTPPAP